jgi:hypothetical protein
MTFEEVQEKTNAANKLIVEFLNKITIGGSISQKVNLRKNKGRALCWYVNFNTDLTEQFEIDGGFIEDMKFHYDWAWLWILIQEIEKLGYSLVIYPEECYWLDENGDYVFEETFRADGTKRFPFCFDACIAIINKLNLN